MLEYMQDVLLPAAALDADLHRQVEAAMHHTLLLARMARNAGDDATADEYLADTVAELTYIIAERGFLLPLN